MCETDIEFMRYALALARQAADEGEVPVGAVVVDPDTQEIVGEGYNQPIANHDPTAHAEIMAMRAAARMAENYRLTGLSIYVTLEPCAMCAGAISFARFGRVVFGAEDKKGGAVVNGARFFEQSTCHWRPEVQSGVLADEASDLLRRFFKKRR